MTQISFIGFDINFSISSVSLRYSKLFKIILVVWMDLGSLNLVLLTRQKTRHWYRSGWAINRVIFLWILSPFLVFLILFWQDHAKSKQLLSQSFRMRYLKMIQKIVLSLKIGNFNPQSLKSSVLVTNLTFCSF